METFVSLTDKLNQLIDKFYQFRCYRINVELISLICCGHTEKCLTEK